MEAALIFGCCGSSSHVWKYRTKGARKLAQPVAADGDLQPERLEARDGELPQLAVPERVRVREAPPRLRAPAPEHGGDARVVLVALLAEDVERPDVLRREPLVGHPEPQHPLPARPPQHLSAARQVIAKLAGGHLRDAAVVVALAGDLMPAGGHLAHHLRQVLAHPAEHEEGGPDAVLVEQVERPARGALHPRLEAVPLAVLDEAVERPDVEVVFQRHGDQMVSFGRDQGVGHRLGISVRAGFTGGVPVPFESQEKCLSEAHFG